MLTSDQLSQLMRQKLCNFQCRAIQCDKTFIEIYHKHMENVYDIAVLNAMTDRATEIINEIQIITPEKFYELIDCIFLECAFSPKSTGILGEINQSLIELFCDTLEQLGYSKGIASFKMKMDSWT